LPIIAFEDISIGNLEVCFDTLHLFGAQRFAANTPELEQRRLLANLVYRLARSVKSRTACDILCLAQADPDFSASRLKRASTKCSITVATDRHAPVIKRALALHVLSGMSVQEGRWHRPVSRFNADALSTVAEKLDLPPVIAWILLEGRNTEGLAAMLPLAVEAATNGADLQIRQTNGGEQVFAERPILGVPACSADMHTRAGKDVIAEFSRVIKHKHPRFFESIPDARTHSKLMGMAIFHFEGSKLDRWLENKTLAEYRERIERAELHALGLPDPVSHHKLYRILEVECELLWQIRQSHLRAMFGKGRRAT
jgi:hypothetical protein